jgi:hypothetical protein
VNHRSVSVNQWMGIFILISIPLINVIIILVWAFSENPILKNFSRGMIKLTIILFGMAIAILIGLGGNLSSIAGKTPSLPSSILFTDPSVSELETDMEFSKLMYRESYGMTTISGEVTNSTSSNHAFSFIITFYDENENIIGTATGFIQNIEPSQTKTFETVTMDNVKGAKNYRVNIDTVIN